MRKTTLLFMTLLFLTKIVIGQNASFLDGFKYAVVTPMNYKDGSRDTYGIEARAIESINSISIKCLNPELSKNWPGEALAEPCLIAFITISEGKLPNEWNCGSVKIVTRNCKNQIIKDDLVKSKNAICFYPYTCCYPKWANAVSSYFNAIKYNYNPELNKLKTEYPEVENTNETEESIKIYLSSNNLDQIEGIYKSYQADNLPYYKIGIKKRDNKYIAVIIEAEHDHIWKQGEVKAYFEPSSMKGFYSAKWYMGNKTSYETFALMENDAILAIEFKIPTNGEKRTNKFIKMYPPASGDVTFKDKSKSSGSGFFLTTDGIIATNAHVVENAESIEIQISNEIGNFEYSAKVLLVDNQNDVALIKIEDEKFKGLSSIPYSLVEKAEIGEKAFTIGYPLNDVMGTNYKVTDGIVSAISGIADDIRYYQVSVPLQPGNSGGPLFNNDGNIIGITSARLNSKAVGTDIENVNYAIKISYLLNLYNMLPNASNLNIIPKLSNKELKEQVKILKNYVCLIKIN